MTIRLSLLLLLLQLFFTAFPAWADNGAVVLTYHRVGEDSVPSTNVRIEAFEQQLDYLQDNGFTVLPLTEILHAFAKGEALPDRTVAITLDDAYFSIYSEAFPRLQKRGFPFTVFVSTDAVDMGYKKYMTWSQLRELKAAGVTIANHSKSHAYLLRHLPGESQQAYTLRITNEIQFAQQRLVDELGDAPMLFAYPYGEYSLEVQTIVESLGYSGVGQHSGAIAAGDHRSVLARFPINEQYSDINDIALKLKTSSMAISQQSILDPLWQGEEAPRLELTLAKQVEGRAELACYASGQGKMNIEWLDRKAGHFVIQAAKPLSVGRHRYTCTAPDKQRRYQWFSQLWVVNPPESIQSNHTD